MIDNRIVAWLRLRDSARFRLEARRAAAAIKDIGDAAHGANDPLGQLGGAMSNLTSILPKGRTETGILGLTLASLVTVVVAGTPLVIGLAGAITALAGSLGAAALGAGGLTLALAGAAVPLGALGLVAVGLFQGFTKTATAFQNWQKQVNAFGRNSLQAETALSRLNATAKLFGGESLVRAVAAWNKFIDMFRKANQPAIRQLVGLFYDFIRAATRMLPVMSELTSMTASLVRAGLDRVFRVLGGPTVRGLLRDFGMAFRILGGPLLRAATNFLLGFMELAARFAPFLGYLVDDVVNLSSAFRRWATSGSISGLVKQFYDWFGLLKAVGGILITILSGGASSGESMVVTITRMLNRWNAFLKTVRGRNEMKEFFKNAIEETRQFFIILGGITKVAFQFGNAMIPAYITAMGALTSGWHSFMDALAPMKPYWDNVLSPILKGIIDGIAMGLVGAIKLALFVIKIWATYFGVIGRLLGWAKPLFHALGIVIGFVFGGEMLEAVGIMGRGITLLRPLGRLFELLSLPIRGVGRAIEGLMKPLSNLVGRGIAYASRFSSTFRNAVTRLLDWLTGTGGRFFDAGVKLWKALRDGVARAIGSGAGFAADIGKSVYNYIARKINHALPNHLGPINIPDNPIPMLAGGGVVSGVGSWITGEAGPELNTLTTGGHVIVKPLTPSIKASPGSTTLPRGEKPVYVSKLYLRGRQIAEAVADEVDDENHR